MSTTRDALEMLERGSDFARASLSAPVAFEPQTMEQAWSPQVDIIEAQDRYVLQADLPGVPIEHIELRIENDRLYLKGRRVPEGHARKESYHCMERPHGRFNRSFALPPSVAQSAIRAEMKSGVLEVVLPKRTEARSRPIKIESR